MVVLLLRHLAHPHGEIERLAEIVEGVRLLQVMPVDDAPAAAELRLQRLQLAALQRRHPAAARYALLASPARS